MKKQLEKPAYMRKMSRDALEEVYKNIRIEYPNMNKRIDNHIYIGYTCTIIF